MQTARWGLVLVMMVACERNRAEPNAPAAPLPAPVRQTSAPPSAPTGPLTCFAREHRIALQEQAGTLAIADVDGNGHADLLVQYDVLRDGRFRDFVDLYLGDGRGGFRPVGTLPLGNLSYSLTAGDLDGDGHVDIIANSYREGHLVAHRGRGDGSFEAVPPIATGRKPTGVQLADLDGDGALDLWVSALNHVQVHRHVGRTGELRYRREPPMSVAQAPERAVLVDIDGDGDRDAVTVSNDRSRLLVFRGEGGRLRPVGGHDTCGSPSEVSAADFDGDGDVDLAFSCDHEIELRIGDGRGGFVPRTLSSPHVEHLAVGELTGDGVPDLLSMGRKTAFGGADVRLFEGDGAGGFRVRAETHLDGYMSSPVVGDFDGDGRDDVAAALWPGRAPGYVIVWLGGGC